ncbi:MAG TPA: hypothetical protein VF153_07880 [Candidatus Limnocylindria bacterium]
MVVLRLTCEAFYVDVRVREFEGRFVASADSPQGPTLGLGYGAIEAITAALAPFDDAIDELMDSLPDTSGATR